MVKKDKYIETYYKVTLDNLELPEYKKKTWRGRGGGKNRKLKVSQLTEMN